MAVRDNIEHELRSRFQGRVVGKIHLSVRYEPEVPLIRVGACLDQYTWENRAQAIDALLELEDSHDEFALEFDVIPLEGVNDAEFAEV